jgi:hypothetical protein
MMMVGRIRVGLEGPDAFAVFQEAFLDNKHRCQPISHDGGWWINADQQHNNTTTTVKESTLQQMSMLGSVLLCCVLYEQVLNNNNKKQEFSSLWKCLVYCSTIALVLVCLFGLFATTPVTLHCIPPPCHKLYAF